MKVITKKMEKILLSGATWVFFTVILLLSLILLKEGEDLETWTEFLSFILSLSIVYAPILIFSSYRDRLKKVSGFKVYALLWFFCFILYHLLLILGRQYFFESLLLIPYVDQQFLYLVGILFLFSEIAIWANDLIYKGQSKNQWLRKVSLEKVILILLIFVALLAVYNNLNWIFPDRPITFSNFVRALPTLFFWTVQYLIILFIYYCFYWVNHYILINKLFKQRGIVYYCFGLAGTILLFYPISAQLIYWLPITIKYRVHPVANGNIFQDINAWVPLMGMVASIPFIMAIQWFKQMSEITTLEKAKSETELNLLKQQINPHFFFNTLNNLYSLSLTKDEQTPEVILQLSELMRYVIYKGKENQVPLGEEIKYIEDYVRLQQIRLHKKLDFKFEKNIENEQLLIPPLLFITFIENAFKHGLEPAEGACLLHLFLINDADTLIFKCVNSMEEKVPKENGIGLENLQRRLQLRFPNQFELQTFEEKQQYTATLKIKIS